MRSNKHWWRGLFVSLAVLVVLGCVYSVFLVCDAFGGGL